jgi:nicotinamide mononucleotide transporter
VLDLVQWIGAALGAAYVVLAIRQVPWCWPIGIGNAVLFLVAYVHARIYGAAGLQAVYVVVSIYGWYAWLHGGADHGRLEVSRTPAGWAAGLAVSGAVASLVLGLVLKHRTNDALPFPDAAVTAFSLVAQWMATRKWLENWLLWIVLNVSNVAICVSQGLYPMSALYLFFLVLAVFGFREWSRSMRQAGPAPAAAT